MRICQRSSVMLLNRSKVSGTVLYPKLLAEQFDKEDSASICIPFAGKSLVIIYQNPHKKDFGSYMIHSASCDGESLSVSEDAFITIPRKTLDGLTDTIHTITVVLW